MMKNLAKSPKIFRGILDSMVEHVALVDVSGKILLTNRAWDEFARNNGDPSLEKTGVGVNYLDVCRRATLIDPAIQPILDGLLDVLAGRSEQYVCEYPCHSPTVQRWFVVDATLLHGVSDVMLTSHFDVTRCKLAELEREKTIEQLQSALAQIKILRGMFPICAHCKRIRDEQGAWVNLEEYVTAHADVLFSHGLCPDCVKLYYAEYAENEPGEPPQPDQGGESPKEKS